MNYLNKISISLLLKELKFDSKVMLEYNIIENKFDYFRFEMMGKDEKMTENIDVLSHFNSVLVISFIQ